jgi:hypothetical protein
VRGGSYVIILFAEIKNLQNIYEHILCTHVHNSAMCCKLKIFNLKGNNTGTKEKMASILLCTDSGFIPPTVITVKENDEKSVNMITSHLKTEAQPTTEISLNLKVCDDGVLLKRWDS